MATIAALLFHKGFDFDRLGVGPRQACRAIAPEAYKAMAKPVPKDAPVKTFGDAAVARRREQKRAYMMRVRERAKALGVKETRAGFVAAVRTRETGGK